MSGFNRYAFNKAFNIFRVSDNLSGGQFVNWAQVLAVRAQIERKRKKQAEIAALLQEKEQIVQLYEEKRQVKNEVTQSFVKPKKDFLTIQSEINKIKNQLDRIELDIRIKKTKLDNLLETQKANNLLINNNNALILLLA